MAEGMKNYNEALVSYQKALALDPEYHLARFNLAQLLAKMGQPERAREELQRVEEILAEQGPEVIPELREEDLEWIRSSLHKPVDN